MAKTIKNRKIDRVFVIDDDEATRSAMELTVEDSDFQPVVQNEKILNIDAYLINDIKQHDAVVSDHHLKKKNYFPVNGSEVMWRCYDRQIPGVLVTRYEQAVIDEIRKYRQKIPVILNPDEFDPDSLIRGLEICVGEFNGEFLQTRKIWRTLIRIDDVNENHFFVIIPSWNPNEMISIMRNSIPKNVADILKPDCRLHAKVNIDATTSNDLFFVEWEIK